MTSPYDSFRTGTVGSIIITATTVIKRGSPQDVDDVFAALKSTPPRIREQILKQLENFAVNHAGQIGAEWNGFKEGSPNASKGQKMVLFDHGAYILQLPEVFIHLAEQKKDKLHPLTKFLAEKFNQLLPDEKLNSEKLAACYGAGVAAVPQAPVPDPEDLPYWRDPLSIEVFQEFGGAKWKRLRAQIDVMDPNARKQLMLDCEYAFINMIKLDMDEYNDITAKNVRDNAAFGQYLIAARGAAADPLLKAYVDIVTGMPLKEDVIYHRREIVALAQAHVTAQDSHAQLKQLAEARKKRAAKVRALIT